MVVRVVNERERKGHRLRMDTTGIQRGKRSERKEIISKTEEMR